MIGFIGTGNMGGAVARVIGKEGMLFSNRTPEKAEKLAVELNGQLSTNIEIAQKCHMIFLGIKPKFLKTVLDEIGEVLKERKDGFTLVSMVAGVSTDQIRAMVGNYPIIRIMPNTPIVTESGVVQFCAKEADTSEFLSLIKNAGLVDEIDESLMDAASAVSGCGPAFCYMFIEALADGGVAVGLPRDKAIQYAAKMVEGAAKLVLQSGKHPEKLKDEVCSPGGTTIQGVRKLEERGFRGAAMEAVIADYESTKRI